MQYKTRIWHLLTKMTIFTHSENCAFKRFFKNSSSSKTKGWVLFIFTEYHLKTFTQNHSSTKGVQEFQGNTSIHLKSLKKFPYWMFPKQDFVINLKYGQSLIDMKRHEWGFTLDYWLLLTEKSDQGIITSLIHKPNAFVLIVPDCNILLMTHLVGSKTQSTSSIVLCIE